MLHAGLSRNPALVALVGLALLGIGLVRGGLLPLALGAGLLVLAAARAWSVWQGRPLSAGADRARPDPAGNPAAERPEAVRSLRALAPSLLLNLLAPIVVYTLVRPSVGSDTGALVIGAAIPVLRTVGLFALRRRIDLVGVLAIGGFALSLAVTAIFGGNPLLLKLHPEVVLTGGIGVLLLGSAAVGRPVLPAALRLLARGDPARTRRMERLARDPTRQRAIGVVTVLLGLTLLIHALALLALALTLPTSSYLLVSQLAGWAVLVAGGLLIIWYVRQPGRAVAALPAPTDAT